MEKILELNGTWICEKDENFEEFLLAIGFSYLKRKAAIYSSSVTELKISKDGLYSKTTTGGLKVISMNLTWGNEYIDEELGKGYSKLDLENSMILGFITHQTGKEFKTKRYVNDENKMILEIYIDDFVCKRIYIKQE
jgi:hypothetical protein